MGLEISLEKESTVPRGTVGREVKCPGCEGGLTVIKAKKGWTAYCGLCCCRIFFMAEDGPGSELAQTIRRFKESQEMVNMVKGLK